MIRTSLMATLNYDLLDEAAAVIGDCLSHD